jgi:hypothetical protein
VATVVSAIPKQPVKRGSGMASAAAAHGGDVTPVDFEIERKQERGWLLVWLSPPFPLVWLLAWQSAWADS